MAFEVRESQGTPEACILNTLAVLGRKERSDWAYAKIHASGVPPGSNLAMMDKPSTSSFACPVTSFLPAAYGKHVQEPVLGLSIRR